MIALPIPELTERDTIRFWSKVDKSGDCWSWMRYRNAGGYGRFSICGKPRNAARISYILAFGEIPHGLYVCHRCDNPACVNPAHLFAGSINDNTKDMVAKGRQARGERHPSAKLTEAQVIAIKQLYPSGEYTYRSLGRMFCVSDQNIKEILSGKIWTCLLEAR